MKKFFIIFAFLIIGLVLSAVWLFFDISRYSNEPAGQADGKIVVIEKGRGFVSTTKLLEKEGLIKNPYKFRALAIHKGVDTKIKAGEYLLSPEMSPARILDILVSGKILLHKLTVPEGFNLSQIAESVEKAGLGKKSKFLEKTTDASLVGQNGIGADTFEGYLFPDTYHFPRDAGPEKIIRTMLKRFHSVFTPEWRARAASLGLTVHQTVTLASIVEKETGAPSERPIISSVFHNRLKRKMRLESDPTVIYGIKNFNGNLTKKDLKTLTPYNTYRIRGLPPGPIANPGKESIRAVLYPAKTKFLYFVSKNNGTHAFSPTLPDHNRAVRKYQLR